VCGIAGFLLRNGQAQQDVVAAMCDRIEHRGPDDAGYFVEDGLAIGMRRLSIIDLSGGNQPIPNEDRRCWIVFNGEIYNYRELRPLVESWGHRLSTHSDTEIILHLYEQEGPAALQRLRGMFSIAIWDGHREELFLAVDRFGKKPLYYADRADGLWFGSELKCLQAPGVLGEPDPEALRIYLEFGFIPAPWSAYRGVSKLPPAHFMTVPKHGPIRIEQYWMLPVPGEHSLDIPKPEAEEQLRSIFDEAVRLRTVADVPLGAFLSGGLDSSMVVASLARQSAGRIKTFSVGVEDEAMNELPLARLVAQRYATEHTEIMIRPQQVLDLLPSIPEMFDEPFADYSAVPSYLVFQMARRHVKVALSGDGGDEIFAGYTYFQQIEDLRRWDRLPGAVRAVLRACGDALPVEARGKNYLCVAGAPHALERYFEIAGWSFRPMREAVLNAAWRNSTAIRDRRKLFGAAILDDSQDVLTQAMYFEATARLSGQMLVKVDRMSMANSIEVRSPLLDHRLAEFGARIPHGWKMRDGRGKRILVDSMGDRLPPELLSAPKRGFTLPMAAWLRGPLRSMAEDVLTDSSFLGRGIVQEKALRQMLDEHQRARRDHSSMLWLLMVMAQWWNKQR
jgi:asparagine synthase (glutamine-hydrolysing)